MVKTTYELGAREPLQVADLPTPPPHSQAGQTEGGNRDRPRAQAARTVGAAHQRSQTLMHQETVEVLHAARYFSTGTSPSSRAGGEDWAKVLSISSWLTPLPAR